jgi:hypothetical protein
VGLQPGVLEGELQGAQAGGDDRPASRAVLKQFVPEKPTDYYFSPRASVEQFHAERAAEPQDAEVRFAHEAERHRFDLEGARTVLGHERMNTTEI